MKSSNVKVFWIGFGLTAALTAWIYWFWRQKRVVAPEPIFVSRPTMVKSVQPAGSKEKVQRVMVSDPLEEINGIGPVFANRLNDAGIYTFAQLSNASPAEIQSITGVTRWDPADWIAEAKKLADDA
jgi:predicted flap endonuclease-1-like 5' DNA nuclease